jgi:hypothetical protein
MENSAFLHINNSQSKVCKQLWTLGDKHLVIIDKSIIEKLEVKENSTVFLEQEITDDKTILMKIKHYGIEIDRQRVGSSLNKNIEDD